MKTYTVNYERDENRWWVATVRGVAGCHTQGRTINEARRRIREALKLFVDGPVQLKDVLPAPINQALLRFNASKQKALKAEERANRSSERLVLILSNDYHLSTRDTGEVLGLSHQRIHQIRQKAGAGRRRHA